MQQGTDAPHSPTADEPGASPAPEVIPAPSADGAGQAAPPQPAPAPPAPPPNPLAGLPDAPAELAYIIVNEAGASVYSASPVGREEFPNFDATLRGTISIGRRLQDPLSELVKIDPQHVGVGLYQHDVSPRQLRESLDGVVESCVNSVGVDLNTASVPLLRHVSGLNQLVARDLVEHRKTNGPFQSRDQLKQVNGIGEARFVQAAGFLKITEGGDPLDGTWIHPESYGIARQILSDLGFTPEDLRSKERLEALREKLNAVSVEEIASRLQAGAPTVDDILAALARPGRDPREDLPPPIFKKGVLKLEDLQPGMELKGTVLNVVDFGAFIDIGLKDSGLVHISQMANRYVKSPYDVTAVGDVVTVWVLAVDKDRRRVSLTMIQPGTERKPPEKKPQPPRREGPPPAPDLPSPRAARPGSRRPAARRPPPTAPGTGRGAGFGPRAAARRSAAAGGQSTADAARHVASSHGGTAAPRPRPRAATAAVGRCGRAIFRGRGASRRGRGAASRRTASPSAAQAAPHAGQAEPVAGGPRRGNAAGHLRRIGRLLGGEKEGRGAAPTGGPGTGGRRSATAAGVTAARGSFATGPDAIHFPSGAPRLASRVLSSVVCAASQILTVRSPLPVAIRRPSRLKATAYASPAGFTQAADPMRSAWPAPIALPT